MHRPKHMLVAYAMDATTAVTTPRSSLHQQTPMRTLEIENEYTQSDASTAESDINTINGKGNGAAKDIVAAIRYKHSTDRKSQVG